MQAEFPQIYAVSQLTRMIKSRLEGEFALVWVRGEISNVRYPQSGHCYFTLKDQASQIRVVIFRSSLSACRLKPADTLQIICRGQLTVYEPRGEYQLIVDYLEPLGMGALAQAFEELKNRLAAEGLFDARHKKPIPFLPRRLGVVTSPSGAALRDFLQVLTRRFPNVQVLIYPVRVQGQGAAAEIAAGIQALNAWPGLDVIILTRGGGSLEDLWAFNEEIVARAIFASKVPVVSAVGHEIDVTIADFVADLRAPTPSAAAELVVRRQDELRHQLNRLAATLRQRFLALRRQSQERLRLLAARLGDPRRRLTDLRLRLDDRLEQLLRLWHSRCREAGARLKLASARLNLLSIRRRSEQQRFLLQRQAQTLARLWTWRLQAWRQQVSSLQSRLEQLNPCAILARGYAMAAALPTEVILRDAGQVPVGSDIMVYLARGALQCRVTQQWPEKTYYPSDHD
ncbi:MAG: exodeoxyribonuclease VII large subunit [Desulfobacca sp.]|uniref:exodeoxyribonuclease VII large subunit n=1 Tax=Desulfobacca sp. TaxID=2067990 RepID=UPI00404AC1C7